MKSTKLKNHRYIGDPINAVRIFNDLKADELVFLDINATKEGRLISLEFVKTVGEEANMPFSVGGGIRNIEDIRKIIEVGAEKVILNTIAGENPEFIKQAVETFGSSTIAVCIDIKTNLWKKEKVMIRAGKKAIAKNPVDFALKVEELGAGEIIIQSIDKDGTMMGYDIELIKKIVEKVSIPIVALGGAGKIDDFSNLRKQTTINGFGAGSLFVYHGPRKAVLVNYPTKQQIKSIFI